jgi:hypothetical protein
MSTHNKSQDKTEDFKNFGFDLEKNEIIKCSKLDGFLSPFQHCVISKYDEADVVFFEF